MFKSLITLLVLLLSFQTADAVSWLKQSTAVVVEVGPFVDITDGSTLETGLVSALDHGTTGIKLSKNGGTLTIRHATVTATEYDAHGFYKVTLDTTDTNTLGRLLIAYSDTTALPVWQEYVVLPGATYDAFIANAAGAANGLVIAGTNAPITFTGAGAAMTLTSTSGNGPGLLLNGNGSGSGLGIAAGATGTGIGINTTAGDGIAITPTAGNGITVTANGTSKHGVLITGGTAGTSDGLKVVAGTGGAAIRANITGNLSGSVGSVAGQLGAVTLMGVDALIKDSLGVVYPIFIRDAATGLGLTGLTNGSTGLTISYARTDQGDAAAATCSPAAGTRGSWTSCGFVEKDATNQPGIYEFGIPNAAIATGSEIVIFQIFGVAGMAPTQLPIALVDTGLLAIASRLGTPVAASIAADIANVQTSATGIKNKTDLLTFTGADLGTIVNNYASGKGPLQPTTAGRTLDVGATGGAGVDWANIKAPTTTVGLTGTTISTSQAVASVTGAVGSVTGATGSVTGAVGSVTGAVGSVTGNLGGNVTGSVGSIANITFPTNFSAIKVSAAGGVQASTYLKNTASQPGFYLIFYSASTPGALVTGLGSTWTMSVSKDGGAFAGAAGTKSEVGGGIYYFAPAQADTNCNVGIFSASGTDVAVGAVRDFITTK